MQAKIDFADPESVRRAFWTERRLVEHELAEAALRFGFTIAVRSSEATCLRFACHCGGQAKNSQKSTAKILCPFKMTVRYTEGRQWHVTIYDPTHTCTLVPCAAASVSPSSIVILGQLRQSGASNSVLSNWVHIHDGIDLCAADLDMLLKTKFDADATLILTETEKVIFEVTQSGGRVVDWVVDTQSGPMRAGLFVQTPEQLSICHRFGDVVFLDSTHISNRGGWVFLMLVLINTERPLELGGLFMTAFETKEFSEWMIDNVRECCPGLLTFLVDRDQAFEAAFEAKSTEMPGVALRNCVYHMQAALQRALARSGVPVDKQAECERCFDDVCYSQDPAIVVKRLDEICRPIPVHGGICRWRTAANG
jgi:hypothetical protein